MQRRCIAAAACAVAFAGIAACSPGRGLIAVRGTETVYTNPLAGRHVRAAYPDIKAGAPVMVVNGAGKVIGTGTLRYSATATARELKRVTTGVSGVSSADYAPFVAEYVFTVTVPAGAARYGITTGQHRRAVWFSGAQMRKGPALTLGSING